jgi:DNA modification methylase
MGGAKAHLLLTDPPYGVSYEGKSKGREKILNDDLRGEPLRKFLYDAFANAESVMEDDASAYVFHADGQGETFRRAFREAGFKLSGVCQWVKPSLVVGRSVYQWRHESILFGWKAKGRHRWYSGRAETTVWEFDRPQRSEYHCTQKPIPLLAYPIRNSTREGDVVLDCFSGGFSTGMACEQTGRVCYAMELDPMFASASIRRFVASYGDGAVSVERGGRTLGYAEVAGGGG